MEIRHTECFQLLNKLSNLLIRLLQGYHENPGGIILMIPLCIKGIDLPTTWYPTSEARKEQGEGRNCWRIPGWEKFLDRAKTIEEREGLQRNSTFLKVIGPLQHMLNKLKAEAC